MSRLHYICDLNYLTDLPTDAEEGDAYWVRSVKAYYIYEKQNWVKALEELERR